MFGEHAVIDVQMSDLGHPEPIPRWFKPKPVTVNAPHADAFLHGRDRNSEGALSQGDTCQTTAVSQTGFQGPSKELLIPSQDATTRYANLWTQWEDRVHAFLRSKGEPGLLANQRGRGQTVRRTFHIPKVHAIKAARHGELTIDCAS